MRACCLAFALAALGSPAVAAGQDSPPLPIAKAISEAAAPSASCHSNDPAEVVVCGRYRQQFRIDPQVLAADRAAERLPPKPPLDASRDTSCTGANCGGGTIPLVGMALTVLKAVELAAKGDDWREAFRTRPDQYQLYEQSIAAKKPRVSIGVTAGSK